MAPLLAVIFVLSSAFAFGQTYFPSYESAYSLVVETTTQHSDGLLAGQTTYRIFAVCNHPDDVVGVVYGDEDSPLNITSSSPFYQHVLGGATPNGINPLLFGGFPELEYDSWATIGIDQSPLLSAGEGDVVAIQNDQQQWMTDFEMLGQSIVIDDFVGGSWYATDNLTNGIAGEDLRVLLMQLTTTGDISGIMRLQVYEEGASTDSTTTRPYLTFASGSLAGCTQSEACNYNPSATEDDGSCDYCICPEATLVYSLEDEFPADTTDYTLRIEQVVDHTDGPLAGQSTYRFYVHGLSGNDRLSAGYGRQSEPCLIEPATSFYQDIYGQTVGSAINPVLYSFASELAYDSWVTIGLDQVPTAGEMEVQTIQSPGQSWISGFDSGGAIAIDDTIGGSWYVYNTYDNGLPDINGEVLIGQFTTDSTISGTLPVQILTHNDTGAVVDLRISFPFNTTSIGSWVSSGACGCSDTSAYNYTATALYNNGSCLYYGCTDSLACNYSSLATSDDGSCATADVCDVCNGPGAIYDCGCADIPQGDCDCNGNQLDALGECGGACQADQDADGICDDVDDCIGTLDACEVCNGPGAIYDCGCTEIPQGDCDCNGNQLDALGECGGACAADADADGICDDVDDCIGTLDACEVCNGPGAIY
ncbi:MAG: hypothetical protein P8M07_08360, partial [Flavobacteriales bacterium]|nr:hypothetical protein [Flavobacteriales bacterium]